MSTMWPSAVVDCAINIQWLLMVTEFIDNIKYLPIWVGKGFVLKLKAIIKLNFIFLTHVLMFGLFMYVYSCNALSARFSAVYRALNSSFMIMIMEVEHDRVTYHWNELDEINILVYFERKKSAEDWIGIRTSQFVIKNGILRWVGRAKCQDDADHWMKCCTTFEVDGTGQMGKFLVCPRMMHLSQTNIDGQSRANWIFLVHIENGHWTICVHVFCSVFSQSIVLSPTVLVMNLRISTHNLIVWNIDFPLEKNTTCSILLWWL